MTKRSRRLLAALAAIAANTMCWGVFLLRQPVPSAQREAQRAREESGRFDSTTPILVAERELSIHNVGFVFVYMLLSVPGVAAGGYVGTELPFWLPHWTHRGVHVWRSPGSRSWVLAGGIYLGTGLWWGALGLMVGRLTQGAAPGSERLDQHARQQGMNLTKGAKEARLPRNRH